MYFFRFLVIITRSYTRCSVNGRSMGRPTMVDQPMATIETILRCRNISTPTRDTKMCRQIALVNIRYVPMCAQPMSRQQAAIGIGVIQRPPLRFLMTMLIDTIVRVLVLAHSESETIQVASELDVALSLATETTAATIVSAAIGATMITLKSHPNGWTLVPTV